MPSRNSITASVASSFHTHLIDGALGCSHLQSFPILFHSARICGAHALHSVKRWCRDCLFPQLHHQHSSVQPLGAGHPVVEEGSYRSAVGQQLAAALCCRLSGPAEGPASEACPPWGGRRLSLFVCLLLLYPVAWGPKGHGSGGFLYILSPFPDPDQPAQS